LEKQAAEKDAAKVAMEAATKAIEKEAAEKEVAK
jgi:hypothetical protein